MTRFTGLSETEQRQIRMYGCTELQMKEAVEQSLTFRFSGPALMAASIMSDCQEMLTQGAEDSMIREDVRQALNRAKWILFQYAMQRPVA